MNSLLLKIFRADLIIDLANECEQNKQNNKKIERTFSKINNKLYYVNNMEDIKKIESEESKQQIDTGRFLKINQTISSSYINKLVFLKKIMSLDIKVSFDYLSILLENEKSTDKKQYDDFFSLLCFRFLYFKSFNYYLNKYTNNKEKKILKKLEEFSNKTKNQKLILDIAYKYFEMRNNFHCCRLFMGFLFCRVNDNKSWTASVNDVAITLPSRYFVCGFFIEKIIKKNNTAYVIFDKHLKGNKYAINAIVDCAIKNKKWEFLTYLLKDEKMGDEIKNYLSSKGKNELVKMIEQATEYKKGWEFLQCVLTNSDKALKSVAVNIFNDLITTNRERKYIVVRAIKLKQWAILECLLNKVLKLQNSHNLLLKMAVDSIVECEEWALLKELLADPTCKLKVEGALSLPTNRNLIAWEGVIGLSVEESDWNFLKRVLNNQKLKETTLKAYGQTMQNNNKLLQNIIYYANNSSWEFLKLLLLDDGYHFEKIKNAILVLGKKYTNTYTIIVELANKNNENKLLEYLKEDPLTKLKINEALLEIKIGEGEELGLVEFSEDEEEKEEKEKK